MLKVLAVVIIGYLAVVTAKAVVKVDSLKTVKFIDCGSKGGVINSVSVNPCPQEPCPFKRNSNVSVEIDFTSEKEIGAAENVVHGIIAGVPVPFPLKDKNACDDMKCPVSTGSKVIYKNVVFVESSFPNLRLVVKWELVDKKKNDIVCFEVPVEIVP